MDGLHEFTPAENTPELVREEFRIRTLIGQSLARIHNLKKLKQERIERYTDHNISGYERQQITDSIIAHDQWIRQEYTTTDNLQKRLQRLNILRGVAN